MSGRAEITIRGPNDRNRAHHWINQAKPGTRVQFKGAQRTIEQNDKMWAMLTDIATQITWHGRTMKTDDWKLVFLDGLKREAPSVPNLDGTGFVSLLGTSSSDLSTPEMRDLIELMYAFGAEHGVEWSDPKERAA